MSMSGHQTVLLDEALRSLRIRPGGVYIDATFGRGGHSRGMLQALGADGRVLAFDRDPEAINSPEAMELSRDSRFTLVQACFAEMGAQAAARGLNGKVSGVLLDLGVSSPQLDAAGRGFSFMRDGGLDMRMDTTRGMTAAEYLRLVDEAELARVLFEYGEERHARRIARAIVEQRRRGPLETTSQLADLIKACAPATEKHKHPATRTFQAIRIEINQELEQLRQGLTQAVDLLEPGGRLAVIAFHSLEDRLVKRFIRTETGRKFNPGRLPVREELIERGRLQGMGKPIKPGDSEVARNPRARSAVMRVAEKV